MDARTRKRVEKLAADKGLDEAGTATLLAWCEGRRKPTTAKPVWYSFEALRRLGIDPDDEDLVLRRKWEHGEGQGLINIRPPLCPCRICDHAFMFQCDQDRQGCQCCSETCT